MRRREFERRKTSPPFLLESGGCGVQIFKIETEESPEGIIKITCPGFFAQSRVKKLAVGAARGSCGE